MSLGTYADAFGIMGSLTDMKIDFFSVNPNIGPNGQLIGEERIAEQRIILSLPLAKDFAAKLSGAVRDYENNFGKVLNLDEARNMVEPKETNG